MNGKPLVFFFLLHITASVTGQADTLLYYLQSKIYGQTQQDAKKSPDYKNEEWPKAELQSALYDWFLTYCRHHRQDTVLQQLVDAEKSFLREQEIELARLAWSLRFLQDITFSDFGSLLGLYTAIEQYGAEATRRGWQSEFFETRFVEGYMRFQGSDFGAGLELMLKYYDEMESKGWPGPVMAMILHQRLGTSFYKFGDNENCIHYLRAGQRFPVPRSSIGFDYQSLNSIGLCFSRLGQLDSAIHYLTLSREYALMHRDSFWMCLMDGNMGNILFQRGETERAKSYLLSDYHGSIRAGVFGSAANAASLLATIELEEGHPQQAETYLQFSRMHRDTFDLESSIQYYGNLFHFHKLKEEYALAVTYADTMHALKKKKDLVMDRNVLDRAEIKVQMAKYDAEVKWLKTSRNKQILLRNSLIIILVLSAGIAILWIKRIMLKRQVALERLEQTKNELSRYTQSLLEKNEIILSFQKETDRMRQQGFNPGDRSVDISALTHTFILTEEDWRQFRQLFDTVYPGFLVRLRDKFGDLTPAEMRLLALTKLQLPVNDMAQLLGISPDSIRKTRYRLRKKLNLPEEGTLEELIALV